MAQRETNSNPESAATRERLVDAAERLFAEHGFRSASVRDITRQASCNIASVNYHFGGKNNLYREVFLRRLRDLRKKRLSSIESVVALGGDSLSLEELLRTFTGAFVEPLVEENSGRQWLMLIDQEMIDPQLPPETFHSEMILPLQQALGTALVRVCPDLDREQAELCAHSLIGQLLHVVKLQRCLPEVRGEAWSLPEMVEHTLRFSVAGIRTLPQVAVAVAG
jgi:AcrR family transcriptional regulator